MGDSPLTSEGGQAEKKMVRGVGAVGCEPHRQIGGAVGIMGGVKREKLCQSFGTLTKFIY